MMRRNGATPRARERKEMFADRVRSVGAKSADGGRDAVVEDGAVERVAQVEIRE